MTILTIILLIFLLAGIYEVIEHRTIVQGRNLIGNGEAEQGLKKFENARPIFRQELDFIKGETYKSLIEKDGFEQWGSDGTVALEEAIRENPGDSGLKNLAAELYFSEESENSKKKAQELIKKALELDSKNWLRYYYNWITMNDVVTNRKAIRKLLWEYYRLLKVNTHNTIMTDNPHYAALLADLIGEKELAKKITYTAIRERKKFSKNFDIPLPKF